MGLHVWVRGSGRHPHWTCMLSEKDKLEFCYRSFNFVSPAKIIIEFPAITSKKKKRLGILAVCEISPSALSPPSPPSPHPPPLSHLRLPPGIPRRIAIPMPAILNLKFKVARFFLITVCGYLTTPPGQQILRPIQ